MLCYCNSKNEFQNCCERIIKKVHHANSPEQLMRSRYTAFALKNFDYLLATHDPKTKADFDLKSNQSWANSVEFTKLEIIKSTADQNKGTVEFKAYYTEIQSKKNFIHHELSQFRKENNIWYFVSGENP